MQQLFLLIVTGMSGAGKSSALMRLEDNGFYCVDNLPSKLLSGFVEQCKSATPAIMRAAVGIDARENAFGLPAEAVAELLKSLDIEYQIIFLDCSDDILHRRYIETRRRHPFAKDGDALLGIRRERALLMHLRENAHVVIDTSKLTPHMLFSKIDEALCINPAHHMTLSFMSFGFKRGIPMEADIVLDMRFLPNPFYIASLREKSGLDEDVRAYVMSDPAAAPFFDSVEHMLRAMLPGYSAQGKQRVMAAFGCTGGRHRSVAAAEEMKKRLENIYSARCFHRDLKLEADEIATRFFKKEAEE